MGFNELYFKRVNSTLSVTGNQFESAIKSLCDVYIAYSKALRACKFKRVDVINFWLYEKVGEDHEFSIKKSSFKSK